MDDAQDGFSTARNRLSVTSALEPHHIISKPLSSDQPVSPMYRLATFRTRPIETRVIRNVHLLRYRSLQNSAHASPTSSSPRFLPPSRPVTNAPNNLVIVQSSIVSSLRVYFFGATIFLTAFASYFYLTDTRSSIHLLAPSIFTWLYDDAEDAHEAGNAWLRNLYRFGLHPRERASSINSIQIGDGDDDEEVDLSIELFGHTVDNPIGTSAGIDKHAEIPDPLFALGPAVIELGGATPDPQDGNPRPRVFRLPSQKGLVNRYGLNSEGADHMAMRLRERVRAFAYRLGLGTDEIAEQAVLDGSVGVPGGSLTRGKLLAVQVAKNKVTDEKDIEAVRRDYVYCVERLARYADIIVVNVSSPNTPGLRSLQRSEPLAHILKGVVDAAHSANRATPPAVMVKVSPDEDSDAQVRGIADAVWASGVAGVIVGNTTKRRHDLLPADHNVTAKEAAVLREQGGYSGPQLFERTVKLVKRYRRILDDQIYLRASANDPSSPPSPSATSSTQDDRTSQDELVKQIRQKDQQQQPTSEPSSTPSLTIDTESSIPPPPTTTSKPPPQTPSQTPNPTPNPSPFPARERKIIFATGGITTGAQALEVLAAGASVAQVYTALVYGGVGTITRMKGELGEGVRRLVGVQRSRREEKEKEKGKGARGEAVR